MSRQKIKRPTLLFLLATCFCFQLLAPPLTAFRHLLTQATSRIAASSQQQAQQQLDRPPQHSQGQQVRSQQPSHWFQRRLRRSASATLSPPSAQTKADTHARFNLIDSGQSGRRTSTQKAFTDVTSNKQQNDEARSQQSTADASLFLSSSTLAFARSSPSPIELGWSDVHTRVLSDMGDMEIMRLGADGFRNATGQSVDPYYIELPPSLKVFFYCIYSLIFVFGVCGNSLVCYVVIKNRSMQTVCFTIMQFQSSISFVLYTGILFIRFSIFFSFLNQKTHTLCVTQVTNYFITNLALSDILLCLFAVPITPLYLLHYRYVGISFVYCLFFLRAI